MTWMIFGGMPLNTRRIKCFRRREGTNEDGGTDFMVRAFFDDGNVTEYFRTDEAREKRVRELCFQLGGDRLVNSFNCEQVGSS